MRYPSRTNKFTPLNLPAIPLTLLLVGRSNTLMEEYIITQRQIGKIEHAKIKKIFYPEELFSWKDRNQEVHVVVLEAESDPIHFRERVGEAKLFFSFMDIVRLDLS